MKRFSWRMALIVSIAMVMVFPLNLLVCLGMALVDRSLRPLRIQASWFHDGIRALWDGTEDDLVRANEKYTEEILRGILR